MFMHKGEGMKEKQIYAGRVIRVTLEKASLPNGRVCELEIVHHPGGTAIVALDDDSKVCLVRQYRYVASDWLWELPAGRVESDEAALETAQRELREETGLAAGDWLSLGMIYTSPGVFTEIIHLYLARTLSYHEPALEEHEVLQVHWIELDQALAWVRDGTIVDAKTIAGLVRAANRV